MLVLEVVLSQEDLRANPYFAASGSDERLTAKGGRD